MGAVAGWYTDPSGAIGQLRWWDGTAWTDHVTPDPRVQETTTSDEGSGAVPPTDEGPPPLVEEAPTPDTASAASVASGVPVRTRPRRASRSPERPRRAAASAPDPGTVARAGGRSSGKRSPPIKGSSSVRTGLIVAAIVGLVLLVAVLALLGIFGGESTATDPGADRGSATDPETSSDDVIEVGGSMGATVPPEGTHEVELRIEEPGPVAIDVRGESDFDAVVEVYSSSGTAVDRNDDRGFSTADEVGGDMLDPYLEVELEPGDYTLVIEGWAGDGGTFELEIR